jgi:hypothetical protein
MMLVKVRGLQHVCGCIGISRYPLQCPTQQKHADIDGGGSDHGRDDTADTDDLNGVRAIDFAESIHFV